MRQRGSQAPFRKTEDSILEKWEQVVAGHAKYQRRLVVMETWKKFSSVEDVAEFQKILAMLVKFDELTGRHLRYEDIESHYARTALSTAKPEAVKFFARKDAEEHCYTIVGYVTSKNAVAAASWTHQDGIAQERNDAEVGHPVHDIVCIGDLFARAIELKASDLEKTTFEVFEWFERED